MKGILKKTYLFFITFLFMLLSVFTLSLYKVKADSDDLPYFDTSNVMSDLQGSLKNLIDWENVFSFEDGVRFIVFNEYGFNTEDFGLYIYLYNPQGLEFDFSSEKNKVQFAFSEVEENILREASNYNKYQVALLNKTSNNQFIKLKVLDFSMPTSSERYYCISGIELLINEDINATEYRVASVYGCSTQNNKTQIKKKNLTTFNVDVHHTFYRSDYSSKGTGWANQLSSCYFSLPKAFLTENSYSSLETITAEFYEYFTQPILVLNNEQVYEDFETALGIEVDSANWTSFMENLDFYFLASEAQTSFEPVNTSSFYDFIYNRYPSDEYGFGWYAHSFLVDNPTIINVLRWLFLDENAVFNENYVFDKDAEIIKQYYYDYFELNGEEKTLSDLFISEVEFDEYDISLSNFDYGYNSHTYSLSSEYDSSLYDDLVSGFILKTAGNQSFWDILFNIQPSESNNLLPIVKVDFTDFEGISFYEGFSLFGRELDGLTESKKIDLSEKYFIDKSQISDFVKYCLEQEQQEKEVYIFRYDCCEYFGGVAFVDDKNVSDGTYLSLLSQEMVYLDFDILSFGFRQGESDRLSIVPVVHSPEDVFNPLTPAQNQFNKGCRDYSALFGILGFLVLILFIWIIVTKIIKFIRK